ncbi:MAG: hypothetical protein H6757_04075 [Candidatus Omnitrophica bacterium]|nr:hypothetical protein [Candidatus Omnitrophota bacterium]
MIIIEHRINSVRQLKAVPTDHGVELDLRDAVDGIHIQHDAFSKGEAFDNYIKDYKHSLLIANIKSEGTETKALDVLKNHNIKDFFLLDLSLPALVKLVKTGERRIAVRFSEYEPIEFVLRFKDKINWVWVDCFSGNAFNQEHLLELKKSFKLCLVSPELHAYSTDQVRIYKEGLKGVEPDAVCTKYPDIWKQ